MRVTGDEPEGKAEVYNFSDPESRYPVIVTTSKLLSTGVDVKTCKVIVLDQNISSMTEFKQIIGRGTRIEEDYGKLFFTIIDFRKATELFADPKFDGDPVQVYVPKEGEPMAPPDDAPDVGLPADPNAPPGITHVTGGPIRSEPRRKYVVGDVAVYVLAERVQYMDKAGRLVTESLRDYRGPAAFA